MRVVLFIWKAHLKSAYSALRQDSRTKIAWFIALTFDLVVALWSIHQLLASVAQWKAGGPSVLETRLWLLCLGAWAGICLFTILSTMTLGFGSDQPRLLMTLPISPAARFRALYGLMFFEGIGNWLLLESVVIGIPLAIVLGWQALGWLTLLLLGVAVTLSISLVATLFVIRYVVPHFQKAILIVLASSAGLVIVYMAIHTFGLTLHMPALPTQAPWLVSLLFVTLLVLVAGPFAGGIGKLYVKAFHEIEGRSREHAALSLPGVQALNKKLGRYRTHTGALLVKGLLNQSRNAFTWGRLLIVLICISLFPLARTLLVSYGLSNMLVVVVYPTGVAILTIVEYAAYAVSSEGVRLNYYLVAPPGIATYLRARLTVFLIPALLIGLPLSLVFSWWIGLPVMALAQAILMVILILIGYTTFIVWGSAWDEDLNLASEGMMQVLTQEELPFTPRRLQLLGLGPLLMVMMFLLVWKLPVFLSMPVLVLLDGLVLVAGWRFSNTHLRGLLADTPTNLRPRRRLRSPPASRGR
jgi:hypothetical protein